MAFLGGLDLPGMFVGAVPKSECAAVEHLALEVDAFDPIVMCADRRAGSAYSTKLEGLLDPLTTLGKSVSLFMVSQLQPPLPEGVTHMDDLALLLSPYRVGASNGGLNVKGGMGRDGMRCALPVRFSYVQRLIF